jgi:hypothetical protein
MLQYSPVFGRRQQRVALALTTVLAVTANRHLLCFALHWLQVLLGPFVDVEQPLIAGGMIDVTFQQLFQTQVGS